MPFGTLTEDDGTPAVPPTRFGIMGDPKTHIDPKAVNPMTPEVIEEAIAAHDGNPTRDADPHTTQLSEED